MKLMNIVVPVIGEADGGKPRLVGSGILIVIANEHFLITAAHVLDENAISNLYLPSRNGFVMISGNSSRTSAPNGNRKIDRYDLAYVHLSEEIIQAIHSNFWFLPVSLVDLDTVPTEGMHYMFIGYPHKAVQIKFGTSKVVAQIESYIDKVSHESVIRKANADPNCHIVIHFDAKKAKDSSGNLITPKDRLGMSGGGVFTCVPGRDGDGVPNMWLCGVGIEHQSKNKCLVLLS